MQFATDGVFYKIVRITGPTHNFLALEFSAEIPVASPSVEVLGLKEPARLNAENVKHEVLAGVEDANRTFLTNFQVSRIQFVEDDSPPESVYRFLAFSLVERLAKNLEFSRSG